MNAIRFSPRRLTLAAAAILFFVAPGQAPAAFTLTLTQTGGNVLVTGTGTLDVFGLTLRSGVIPTQAEIVPQSGILQSGPTGASTEVEYDGLTGPTSFGTGNYVFANAGTGSLVCVIGSLGELYLPLNYTSGTPLSDMATFNNASFASHGFTPGTYVYTWGTGADADSLTVVGLVPEPSTWALLGLGCMALLGLVLRPRRRATSL